MLSTVLVCTLQYLSMYVLLIMLKKDLQCIFPIGYVFRYHIHSTVWCVPSGGNYCIYRVRVVNHHGVLALLGSTVTRYIHM